MSGADSLQVNIPDMDYSKSNSPSSPGSLSPSAFDAPMDEFMSAYAPEESGSVKRSSSKKSVRTFISKLYSMIESGRHQHLIAWNPTGTSFFVFNATQFAQEVLPEHFKHSNFSSFVRLLNMYGFHKINKSPRGQRGINENEIWEFSHPKFQRGRPDLLKDIKRKAMDSELLRRETGDIHASFAMLQMSQADLLQQFYTLQDNFVNLLKGFEETKKVQQQQQMILRQLAAQQGGLQGDESLLNNMPEPKWDTTTMNSGSPLKVLVTSPTSAAPTSEAPTYQQMPYVNQCWENSPSNVQYNSTSSASPALSATSPMSPSFSLDMAMNTPLPPSPLASPGLSDHPESPFHMKYDDMNTLGLGYSS
ncbi:HSF-type DNA-binding-domain-containing protein [Radiomyces spectabilis]|uniref:HSF-type DNA-binding-domain-containing protein n=1 Tax=Radiomyces spectabilis TaxID=64574 RepID=UPI0022205490|nr:HSF-type DNA-binding-domain-containing protein [Radiomyces spectabilis]KAI8374277.1 HSF-type DNA-binding-domain-containing protein [Radiomyces spectabilis]